MNDGKINFYGLLYIDRARNLDANIKQIFLNPVNIYVSCAALLAKSAQANGISFGLFTNAPDFLKREFENLQVGPIALETLPFSREIPRVKNYYSAHFKLDAIKALASGAFGKQVGLIDIDTIFLSSLPSGAQECAVSALGALDISNDIFSLYGFKRCRRDLELVANSAIDQPRWFGGEFLAGTAGSMKVLSDEIERCWPRYVDNIKSVHHIGDEMAVSAALNLLMQNGFPVIDMGGKDVVARWWSQRTKCAQPPFEEIESRALLHLPADKVFLSRQARQPFVHGTFLEHYKAHVRRKLARRRVFNLFNRWPLPPRP